jgi:hypothetical protein
MDQIRYHEKGFFKSHVYFDSIDVEVKDKSGKDIKSGIRNYCWLTQLFLKCFGKQIVELRISKSKVLYLDGKGVAEWKGLHRLPTNVAPPASFRDYILLL